MNDWKVKRFVVFSGEHYYPCGGWNDQDDSFDTLEEAQGFVKKLGRAWVQIVDLKMGEQVS